MGCLNCFRTSSRQKVNLSKFQICFSNNVNPSFVDHLAHKAGILLIKDLGRYLGIHSIHNRFTEATFSKVLESVKARLEGWKSKNLSLVGRQVLENKRVCILVKWDNVTQPRKNGASTSGMIEV